MALSATILSLGSTAVSAQAGSWVLPSSAFRGGANGAEFRTDVRILNVGTSRVTVTPTLYDQTSGVAVTAPAFTVEAWNQAAFDNVLASLFGRSLANGSYGPIRFGSTGPIIVSSSVNNVNACGSGATSGQWLPGLDATTAMTAGVIPELAVSTSPSGGYRTNLVLMNPGSESATVTVRVRAGGGVLLSSGTIGPLGPNGFNQVPLDDAAKFPGVAGRTDSNLWVGFTSNQPVLAFASVINNASGDPFALVATSMPPAGPLAFTDSGLDLGSGAGKCVALGDVDADGDVDALVSFGDAPSMLWINDGNGRFVSSDQHFKASTYAALGDLDGNRSLDIFFTEGTSNQVWLNDGRGTFRNTQQSLTSPESAAVALGDLDGDGDLDAFVANWNGQPDQVFLNDGRGAFNNSGQSLGTSWGTMVALGDVDKDGDLDAMVSSNGEAASNSTVLWLNDGHGTFADSGQRLGLTNAYAVVLGDLDSDGDLDAFIANSSHGGANPADKVWINDGRGTFVDSGQSLGTAYSLSAALGDFDGDGDLDVFTGSWQSTPRIWLNDGKASFVDSGLRLASSNSSSAAVADLDRDGDLDVFVATNTWPGGDGRPRLWLNQVVSKP
jgi:hypothetical protein